MSLVLLGITVFTGIAA